MKLYSIQDIYYNRHSLFEQIENPFQTTNNQNNERNKL